MNIVLYTQRVEIVKGYGERRDCADQNIPRFIRACGYLPIAVPNIGDIAEEMMKELVPAGIVLTGGNSLVKYGGNAPERDEAEKKILDYALKKGIPVLGFCRGMQMILDYFGCRLEEVKNHVAVYHEIHGQWGGLKVNSFHNQACLEIKEPLEVLGMTDDGVIEAVKLKGGNIAAIMWHPEREPKFRAEDMQLIKDLFG